MVTNRRQVILGLVLIIVSASIVGDQAIASLSNSQHVTGNVHVHGNPQIQVSPSILNFGNASANTPRTLLFNVTNVGNTQDNTLNFTLDLGTLPGGSVLNLGSCYEGWPSQFNATVNFCAFNPPTGYGINHILPAGYLEVMALTLTLGPAAVDGMDYTFVVNVFS